MPQQKLETRSATADDINYVWNVYKDAIRSHVEPHLKNGWNDSEELNKFRKAWKPEDSHIIMLDGTPIGWGGATVSASSVTLDHLYIEPSHREKGYAHKLVSELLHRWKQEGKVVRAPILRGSPVIKFATELGFEKHSDGHGPLTEMYTYQSQK
jgi:GNAT superfamily N-acetyltransferase